MEFSSNDLVNIWNKIIDVQKHFNEIRSKHHTLFISVITASFIATGYMFSKDSDSSLSLGFLNVYLYSIPVFIAAFITLSFGILDCYIYQKLLSGSVK